MFLIQLNQMLSLGYKVKLKDNAKRYISNRKAKKIMLIINMNTQIRP